MTTGMLAFIIVAIFVIGVIAGMKLAAYIETYVARARADCEEVIQDA